MLDAYRYRRTALDGYMSSLRGIHPLDAETERQLALAYRAGEEGAGERLVEASLPFVIRIAAEYRRWGLPIEDLVQQGNLGLLKAARKYEVGKGVRLITYAVYWIRAEIREYLVRSYRIVRLGTTRSERRAMRSYRREGVESVEELAERSGMPLARCRMLWPLLCQSDASLDVSYDGKATGVERLLGDMPDPEELASRRHDVEVTRSAVRSALRKLDKRERRIVRARLLADEPQTLEQLGRELGVSKERVRQLEVRVRDKLRGALKDYQPAA